MSTQSPEAHDPDAPRPIKRLRFAPRTNLACTACRRRKTRCSGEYPTCGACSSRNEECVFEGIRAQVTVRATASAGENVREGGEVVGVAVENGHFPVMELRRKAIAYFRENYEATLLGFIPPQDLILDDAGQNLPFVLLLSIITLTSRSIPEFENPGVNAPKSSNIYAELTQRELNRAYNKPELATIQACLILSIYEYGNGAEHRAWIRIGHAIRLAQLMQLHKLDSDTTPSDWCISTASDSLTTIESKRRTFWCAFNMERILANGRDRIAILKVENITTRLPQLDEDFIYGRENENGTLKADLVGNPKNREGLYTHLIRILNLLGDVTTWHGNGGRYADSTCPWLPEMPFTLLDQALSQWRAALPKHLDHTPSNLPLILAAGHGKLWIPMFCIFYQARAILHREYMPFTSIEGYDPSLGPCDGPSLTPQKYCAPPHNWWHTSAKTLIESANAITSLHQTLSTKHPAGSTSYPFPGLSLLVAASLHIQCTVYSWPSMQYLNSNSLELLRQDLEACNTLGGVWPVGRIWIHQLTLYHKLQLLTQTSFSSPQSTTSLTNLTLSDIKTGITTHIRENRVPTKFDFNTWMHVLNHARVERQEGREESEERVENSPVMGGWWDGWDVERSGVGDGGLGIFR